MSAETHGSVGRKTVRSTTILLTGVFYSRIVNLAMTIVLARLLMPEDFGLVALGTTVLVILTAVTDLSLANALIYKKDLTDQDFDTAFTLNTLRGLLLSLILIVSGYVMAGIYHDERLVPICFGLALRPFLISISSPRYIIYSKELNFGTVAFQEAANYTVQFVVSVAIASLTKSYWALVAGAVSASIVGTALSYRAAPYRPRISLSSWHHIFSFSIWLTLNQIVSIIGNRFDNFFVGGWLGIGTFGAYNVGNNTASMIAQSAIQPLQRVLFPGFTKIIHDRDRLKTAFQKSQASLFAIGLVAGVGFALVADPFVYLVLGPKWEVAAEVIRYISPVLGMQIVFGPTEALALAAGATKTVFNRGLIMLCFRVPIVFLGLYYYGLTGLLVARVITGGLLLSIVNFYIVRTLSGLTPSQQLIVTWRSWVSGAVMTVALLAMQHGFGVMDSKREAAIALASMMSVGAVTYVGTHALLWLATGRSEIGIEAEIVKILGSLRARLRRSETKPG